MTPIYRLGTALYHRAIHLYGKLGNQQAAQWVAGREEQITPPKPSGKQRVWMHCASLGEWEQGRPVLDELQRRLPDWEFVLSFFSPSGYEKSKGLDLVDHVLYLPPDSPTNAEAWVRELAPDLALFVKYEFWFFHLQALHRSGVPTWLVAASFRPGQLFFKPYGGWYRRMLPFFTGIILQTEAARQLLNQAGKYPRKRTFVAGDPRMDRTRSLTTIPFSDPLIEAFCARRPTIIAGSVWPQDMAVWEEVWDQVSDHWNIIFAPHQLNEADLALTQVQWKGVRYTTATLKDVASNNVLILDTIGMLSKVYRYGRVAYVGGGFKTGLHNTLEPMAYGLPTIFGPNHEKFPEAAVAIAAGGAFSISDGEDLLNSLHTLQDEELWQEAHQAQMTTSELSAGAGRRTADIVLAGLAN
ncbi:3-deoxy-D-manno-octulosonic acid transferase [Lewinella sp. 4G2]|uniref:3-deoxy-D-manno-octulosonic acid transferase n=1 Tax=Lewinella sp. 4G2 TaxID=1803372 RepID=UPI0007B48AB9|nr:glycosyltransferase N-terminal domain-containing protein [Lewinella sp. 4G2]OAV44862.1 hypothetical protein A3850_010325 [Lewinella sp. 4G2]